MDTLSEKAKSFILNKLNLIDVIKARAVNYKYKVATGNPKRPWKYFYNDADYKKYLQTTQAAKKAKQDVKNLQPHNPKPVSSAPTDIGIGKDEDIRSQAPSFQLVQESVEPSGKKGISSEPNLFGITEKIERKFMNQNYQPKFSPSREIMSVDDLVTEVKSTLLKEGMEAKAKEWVDATYNVKSTMSNVLNLAYKFVLVSSSVANQIRKQIVKASVNETKQDLFDPNARKQTLEAHGKDPETPVPRLNDIEKKEAEKSGEKLGDESPSNFETMPESEKNYQKNKEKLAQKKILDAVNKAKASSTRSQAMLGNQNAVGPHNVNSTTIYKEEIDSIVADAKAELKRRDDEKERLLKNALPNGKIVILKDGKEQVEIISSNVEFKENEKGIVEAKLKYGVRNTYYIGKTYTVTEDEFEIPAEINPEKINTILKSATPENRTKTTKELFGTIPKSPDKKMSKADWAKQSVDVDYDPPEIAVKYFDGSSIRAKDYSGMDQSLIIPYDKTMGCGGLEPPKWMPKWKNPYFDKFRILFSDIVINGERKFLCKIQNENGGRDYAIMTQEQIIAMESFYLNKAKELHKRFKEMHKTTPYKSIPPEIRYYRSRPLQQKIDTMFQEQFNMLHERMFGYEPKRYAPDFKKNKSAVFAHFKEIAEEMKYREIDLRLGFQDAYDESTYQKGKETSYGDSGTVDTILDSHGVKVKMQNGKSVDFTSLEEIKNSMNEIYSVFGDRSSMAKNFGLKISHSGNKKMHASRFIGIFSPSWKAIGVSYADETKGKLTLSHEFSHFMDYYLGQISKAETRERGKADYRSLNYASCGYGIENEIAKTFRKGISDKYKGKEYWARSTECFARALEQYFSLKKNYGYSKMDGANPEEEYYRKNVMPLIDRFFAEKEDVLKSFFSQYRTQPRQSIRKKVLGQ